MTHDNTSPAVGDRRHSRREQSIHQNRLSRRDVLGLAGSVAAVGLAGCSSGTSSTEHGWRTVDSPTGKALHDVVLSTKGPYAVGEAGRVLTRGEGDWETAVENGPAGASNGLLGASATADSGRVWFAGDSGAAGYYDVSAEEVTDHSAPKGKTSSWADVAVTGSAENERVLLVNSSGELLTGTVNGKTVEWNNVTKPSSGTSVNAIAAGNGSAYVCDGNGNVYHRTAGNGGNGGQGWESVGVEGVSASLHDIAAPGAKTATVVSDDGEILRYDGFNWITLATAENALHAVDRRGGRGLAVGPGGTVFEIDGTEWQADDTPVSTTLHGTTLGTVEYTDVAVGADGTILENFQ